MAEHLPTPKLPAYALVRAGASRGTIAWCPWCQEVHSHGEGGGHRGAHCARRDSPFRATGYDLDIQGTVSDAATVAPDAPCALGPYLAAHLDEGSSLLKGMVLRFTLGRRFAKGVAEGWVRGAAVAVCGASWWLAPKGLRRGESLYSLAGKPGVIEGRGILDLLVALWGLSAGVVAVRLLQAVTGPVFDAEAQLAIAAAVDAWNERRQGGGQSPAVTP